MTFTFSAKSLANLKGVHPDLVRVVKRAIEVTTVDFKVIEGVRTIARQHKLYGQGRSISQLKGKGLSGALARPGLAVVTWTLNSRHFKQADGFGHAVDLLPAPYDWKDSAPFDAVAVAMFAAALEIGIELRWGADWDQDGNPRERGETDSPHFETP